MGKPAQPDPGRRRAEALAAFDRAIDKIEWAIRDCPEEHWDRSLWVVRRTDPWIWPKDGQAHGRTDAAIQIFSAFWMVAYHCLFFLDFYLWDGSGTWASPPAFADGPEDQGIDENGAAPFPNVRYTRDQLLEYVAYGRARALRVIGNATAAQLRLVMPPGHPRAGRSFRMVLRANLEHLRAHGAELAAFVASGGMTRDD